MGRSLPTDLPGLITAYEATRTAWADMPADSWNSENALVRGESLFLAIAHTRATDFAGLDWKLGELVGLLSEYDGHILALATSIRDDVGAMAADLLRWAPRQGRAEAPERDFDFRFDEHPIRVVVRDGEPWFVAADVCRALDIKNSRDALAALDADEKGVGSTDTLGGPQKMAVISESGLYTLILRCRQATTPGTVPHRFRKWVTAEVLPAIRRKGSYTRPTAPASQPAPTPANCPLAGKRPYFPRALNPTPEDAARRALAAAKKRKRETGTAIAPA